MMAAQHGTYAANVRGSAGDSGRWIREYKKRLTAVKEPWDGKCCFHDCPNHEDILGGHVWIKGQTSNAYYYIVPICPGCNSFRNRDRAWPNWTKLKTGTKLLRVNVKKGVNKLWAHGGYIRRRQNEPAGETEQPVETDIDAEGIVDDNTQSELENAIANCCAAIAPELGLSQSQLQQLFQEW